MSQAHPFQHLLEASPEAKASPEAALKRLIDIMAALRDKTHGCPWDLDQTFATIAPYTIEEAYEVADAIERADLAHLKEELGDLLLQVVFHARMAEEEGRFGFAEVANAINDKLIRRHPHVFGGEERTSGGPERWEEIKKKEKAQGEAAGGSFTLFDDIPLSLPALARAQKLQRRAARIGFDWPSPAPVLEKIEEELAELKVEMERDASPEANEARFEEFGDLLFVLVNLGRHLGLDSEAALRAANAKFTRRLAAMAKAARERGQVLEELTLEEQEALWQLAKREEDAPRW